MRPKVKICCIASEAEARLAIAAGASALGLVSAMPSGPGVIDEVTIARVAASVPLSVDTFLLTALQHADAIVELQHGCRASVLQLVDEIAIDELKRLRAALPGVGLVQVVHVTGPQSLMKATAAASHVDAILLDSGNPGLAVKQLGGTGRIHDWRTSRSIREAVSVPVWLAGGLGAHNIAAAVQAVRPHGVDLCSSVRTEGRLDPAKLQAFFAALPRL